MASVNVTIITLLNAAVERIMGQVQNVRVLIESAPNGIVVVDKQGTIPAAPLPQGAGSCFTANVTVRPPKPDKFGARDTTSRPGQTQWSGRMLAGIRQIIR